MFVGYVAKTSNSLSRATVCLFLENASTMAKFSGGKGNREKTGEKKKLRNFRFYKHWYERPFKSFLIFM